MHARFPVPHLSSLTGGLLAGDEGSDDMPWAAPFLDALERRPTPAEVGWADVCELLLERHVQESPFSVGEFYTPRSVVRLLIDVASPQPGDRILDPACGSGGLLAAAAQPIAESGPFDGASFEAYAMDHSNPPLAMMNMAVHGVDRPVVQPADLSSLYRTRGSGLVDLVLSNPPFNQRIEAVNFVSWPFGSPPESNANLAWLQLAWTRLSENGTAAMIMPPRAAWSSGREAEIRKRMVGGGVLLGNHGRWLWPTGNASVSGSANGCGLLVRLPTNRGSLVWSRTRRFSYTRAASTLGST